MAGIETTPEARAVAAVERMGFKMMDVARWSHIDVANRSLIPAEFLKYVRRSVRPVIGRPIIGNITLPRYYDLRPGEKPAYHYQFLPDYRERGNDFRGVLTGLANVTVPTYGDGRDDKRFCLRVAPLARYKGPDRDEWQDFYNQQGWQERFQHPFGLADYAGRSVMIMVNTIRQDRLHFPETPQESAYVINRTVREL